MLAIWYLRSEPSGTCIQDTLETSLCANHLFPTDDCPAHRYPMPLESRIPFASKARSYLNSFNCC